MLQVSSCCSQFEFCISCCLRPDQRASLQEILTAAAATNNVVFVSVSDHWELCLAKCRTSSESVQHENTYRYDGKIFAENIYSHKYFRNKERKFCFGPRPPPTVAQ